MIWSENETGHPENMPMREITTERSTLFDVCR